jgi:hypothetical protein
MEHRASIARVTPPLVLSLARGSRVLTNFVVNRYLTAWTTIRLSAVQASEVEMRRVAVLLLAMCLALAMPASLLATAYSTLQWVTHGVAPGIGDTSVCDQSGMVDVARNYGQTVMKVFSGSPSCSTANRSLPSGWIGTRLSGYRSGSYCGTTGVLYSNVATSAWQVWSYICSNPSGTQSFYTRTWGYLWTGNGPDNGYLPGGPVLSPTQNY